MNTALTYAQKVLILSFFIITFYSSLLRFGHQALHIQPSDKSILYNIAMIQQKAAEMLFSIQPAKRTLKDLQRAIQQAGHAQKLFATLAADPSSVVPYNKDIADQRRKYGESMLRKQDEHLKQQREYEEGVRMKLDTARQRRQEEKERHEAVEVCRVFYLLGDFDTHHCLNLLFFSSVSV